MKKFFSLLLLFLLGSCQNLHSENSKNEEYARENFHGFQIFLGDRFDGKSEIFYTYHEMEKILENNSKEIYGFGDPSTVHNDDIASMPDFLILKILEKILENPDKIAKDFTIYGLTESQLRSDKILKKVQELPVEKLVFSTFYINMSNYEDVFAKKFLNASIKEVEFYSLEDCYFVSEKGEKYTEIARDNKTISCVSDGK